MQSGINLKVRKRTGRAGPIVALKCMKINMANHIMGYGAPKNHSHLTIEGIFARRDSADRFCLNDFQRAAGGEERHNPNRWLRSEMAAQLIAELTPDMAFASVDVVRGGINPRTYACKELACVYAMWISATFSLKVIRTFDAVQNTMTALTSDRIQAGVILLESASRALNLSNSSKLGAYQKLQQAAGLPDLMPAYTADAPVGAVDGSSRPILSLSTLLKTHGVRLTVNQAYHLMARAGTVDQKERQSRSGLNGVRKFWSVTVKGCLCSKNITSPANPRETQPHLFESKLPELLRLLGIATQQGTTLHGLLTPEIVPRLGVVLFKPGKDLMSLFAQGRVPVTPQPEYMAGFPTGKVPDARQPLSVDRSLVPFFTGPHVITAARGIEGLERQLNLVVRQCQNHDEGYHHVETVILRQDPGSVLLCWYCDNKPRDEPEPAIKEIASRNVIDWVIDMVLLSPGCTRERTLPLAELCWWAVQSEISGAITGAMAEKALRLAPEPHRSVYRDSDIIPAIPAADILERRLDKRESHAITVDLETCGQGAGKPILRLGVDPECPEAFILRPKRRRWICPEYTRWIKTQECVCCRQPVDDPHHIIGYGMGGTVAKIHDLFVIPLYRAHHDELHANLIAFEEKYGSQPELLIRFLDYALDTGVIFKE